MSEILPDNIVNLIFDTIEMKQDPLKNNKRSMKHLTETIAKIAEIANDVHYLGCVSPPVIDKYTLSLHDAILYFTQCLICDLCLIDYQETSNTDSFQKFRLERLKKAAELQNQISVSVGEDIGINSDNTSTSDNIKQKI